MDTENDITSPTELAQYRCMILFAQKYPEIVAPGDLDFLWTIIPGWIDGRGRLTGKQPGKCRYLFTNAFAYSKLRFRFDDEVETDFDDHSYVVVYCSGEKTWIKSKAGEGVGEMIVPTETLRLVKRDGNPVLQPRPSDRRV